MSVHRRLFLKSLAAGSTAYLAGCATETPASLPPPDRPDACVPPAAPTPPDLDYPSADYFAQLSRDLDAAGIGTPTVFIDMDRVDANIDAIATAIPAPMRFRIVEKSLPSLDLLAYVSERSGSLDFMVLHLPFLPPLLERIPEAQVLIGKSHLTSAVASFFDAFPAGTDLGAIARRVTFLADNPARLGELLSLGVELGIALRVAIELDVGLKRSGVTDPADLRAMLNVFLGSADIQFAGFLGYDGHVAHSPGGGGALDLAWSEATEAYRAFVDVLEAPEFAALASLPGLIFNSGGTSTYPMYSTGTPVNDVAVGGGVLRPGGYPNHVIGELLPAIFIATPVFAEYSEPRLPFFSDEQSADILEGKKGLTIGGGGWPAYFTHPPGIAPAPFISDATDHSMVPNQGMVTAPAETEIGPGDWVFYHPRQSDALFQFEQLRMVRGGRLEGETMAAYPRRY